MIATVVLLAAAAAAAVTDWLGVATGRRRVERVAKPATLALLLAAAATADLGRGGVLVLAALAFSLLGDVALLVDDESARPATAFRLGLAAFVGAHVCYLGAFARHDLNPLDLLAGLLVVLGAAGLVARPLLAALWADRPLLVPLAGYSLLLGAMVVLAVGTGSVLVALGGALFLLSDSTLARERFVGPVRNGALLVAVTYHLAQLLILLGLIRHW